ncbi:Rrf2 family transcriptional regulator [Flavobacterium sinopsychrotolerans]|jgi:Rrf2 family nitric oxide-sensitive transcriptional repressor|uniref:Transcriptional regulator, BadM/Rrf2 family n=1 Tax=Flavobacterium sinopsychrotolerans TaxID=604089 RepID=A0A1H8RDI1_9FLAO|nr:Rrf2 family transcriptional regulator [Flavobacterium sinopsychrotolerans]SEO64416.1 transcriptional regulator, BadM/Rrf2 family [Flavobacterium sinopsychrotolerans]
MKLNHFTDFSMRVLMYLNQKNDTPQSSLDDLANTFKISRNHLIKVVQFLSANQLILTKRGKNGGIVISDKAREIRLGDLIHLLEQDDAPIVNCDSKPCIFQSHNCKLKSLFNTAYQTFIESLNQYTLSDIEFKNWSAMF